MSGVTVGSLPERWRGGQLKRSLFAARDAGWLNCVDGVVRVVDGDVEEEEEEEEVPKEEEEEEEEDGERNMPLHAFCLQGKQLHLAFLSSSTLQPVLFRNKQ
jgi:hypothetical protein